MTDVPEFVVTEGRAYHPGDVVLLRFPMMGRMKVQEIRELLDQAEAKTGVKFVFLDESVEVVEPRGRDA